MKQKVNKLWTWIFGGLLGLLGFTSCDPFGVIRCEYGCPHADYKVIGEVTDEAGKPVEGIRAIVAPRGLNAEDAEWYNDTLYTDRSGKISADLMKFAWFDGENKDMEVELADVDGETNGSFETAVLKRSELKLTQTKEGDNHWYDGEYTLEFKGTLKEKSE